MTLNHLHHVTSSSTWPFIYYTCCIATKFVSLAAIAIIGSKHIGVMSLTFQGHVTSLVTWPFDSP